MKKINLDPIKRITSRLNTIANNVSLLQKTNLLGHAIRDCVAQQEHKVILYALLQLERNIILDSRQSCFKNMSAYLKILQPAMLDNLTRIGGCRDGGYVMLPPPPR